MSPEWLRQIPHWIELPGEDRTEARLGVHITVDSL